MSDEFNLEVAVGALASIEMDPKRHNQGAWAVYEGTEDPNTTACGTSYCMAGWICEEAGLKMVWERDWIDPSVWSVTQLEDGRSIPQAACELLGLERYPDEDLDQGWCDPDLPIRSRGLFQPENTLEDLYTAVAHYGRVSVEDVQLDVKHEIERRMARIEAQAANGVQA